MINHLIAYSYAKCGTCRKALKWLKDKNFEFELFDIIENPPSEEYIIQAIHQLGDIKFLLNTSGKSYREIGAKKIKELINKDIIELLISDSKLLKRPFLINDKGDE